VLRSIGTVYHKGTGGATTGEAGIPSLANRRAALAQVCGHTLSSHRRRQPVPAGGLAGNASSTHVARTISNNPCRRGWMRAAKQSADTLTSPPAPDPRADGQAGGQSREEPPGKEKGGRSMLDREL
jgi:hypothetical protein